MKNMFKINKAAKPYIIINAFVFAIVGIFVGKTYVNILNLKRKIKNNEEALKDFLKHMTETCPNKVSLEELEKMENPIEPTPNE